MHRVTRGCRAWPSNTTMPLYNSLPAMSFGSITESHRLQNLFNLNAFDIYTSPNVHMDLIRV